MEALMDQSAADIAEIAKLEWLAELRLQEEVAAMVARMEAMDGPAELLPARKPESYRPAQSTVDAFRYLAGTADVGRLKSWLADRRQDAPFLLKLLENT
jgi:hypothetical protein